MICGSVILNFLFINSPHNNKPGEQHYTVYDKNDDRYKLATTMAKEYLQTRNLTDMRLSGRLQDSI